MTYKHRTFDADFKVLATGIEATQVNTNTIAEKTAAAGVTVDGVLLKDGVVKDSTDTQLSTIQDIQNAAADKASYYFDGASYVSGDAQILGTSALTILTTFKTVKSSASAAQMLLKLGAAIGGEGANNTVGVIIETDNKVKMNYYGSSNAESSTAIEINKYYTAIGVYSGSTLKMYLNGIAGTEVNYSTGNLANNKLLIGKYGASSLYFNGSIGRSIVFNYALSEDKIARYSAGAKLDYEDVGGRMNLLVNSGFETGTNSDGWQTNVSPVYNDTTTGRTGTYNFKLIASVANNGIYLVNLIPYHNYRVTLRYRTDDATNAIRFGSNLVVSDYGSIPATNGSWSSSSFIFNSGASNYFCISSSAAMTFYLDELYLAQLGAVLDLEPENITDNTWFDASPNGLHGTVTGALAQRFTPSYDSRNYIINGGFDFAQRGTTKTRSATDNVDFVCDRWFHSSYGDLAVDEIVSQESSSTSKSGKVLRIRQYAASGFNPGNSRVCQIIESDTIRPLRNKTVTFSIRHRIPVTQGFTGDWVFYTRYDTDGATLTSGAATTAAFETVGSEIVSNVLVRSASNTAIDVWETFTVTFKIPSNASRVALILKSLNGNTNNVYIDFADAMLNEGPVAAPFQRAGGTIGSEELLCKRYYLDLTSSMLTFNMQFPTAYVNTTDAYLTPMLNAVPMAKIPTLEQSGLTGVKSCTIGGAEVGTVTNLVLANATKESYLIKLNGTGFGPTGTHVFLGSSGKLALNAEI